MAVYQVDKTKKNRDMPVSWRQVPEQWWNLVLDGNLWSIVTSKLPFATDYMQLANSYRRRAKLRGLTASIRTRSEVLGPHSVELVSYVQAFNKEVDRRLDFSNALSAPDIPPCPPKVTAHVFAQWAVPDYSGVIERLQQERVEAGVSAVPAVALVAHPWLGWLMSKCGCQTQDWLVHPTDCAVYRSLPLIPSHLAQSPERPEIWAVRNGTC